MFGIGPAYVFLIENRLPIGFMRKGAMPWLSTMSTNAGIAAGGRTADLGRGPGAGPDRPSADRRARRDGGRLALLCSASVRGDDLGADGGWSQPEAALHGSSLYELPPPLDWFSANIGVHHVHHLSSGIPFYRLGRC